jgi:hypothetical protein
LAQKIITRYVDDLDNTEASGPVTFGIDGWQYEIDLNDHNASELRGALARFVDAGRRLGRMGKTTASAASAAPARQRAKVDPEQSKAIREWARKNGHQVGDKGRIPGPVVDAFHAAH